jgi:hypothetical protein
VLDPQHHYFPEADSEYFEPFAKAFLRMMFAHAEFEARIRDLQDTITGEAGFGQQPRNQCRDARKRPKAMATLIRKHLGNVPEGHQAAALLKQAIPLCDDRNRLAHGTWWQFIPEENKVTVAAGSARKGEDPHTEYSATDIDRLADKFKDIEAELYKVSFCLDERIEISGRLSQNRRERGAIAVAIFSIGKTIFDWLGRAHLPSEPRGPNHEGTGS